MDPMNMVFSLYLSYRHDPYEQSTRPSLQGPDIFYMFHLQSGYHSEVSIQNSPWLFYILGRVAMPGIQKFLIIGLLYLCSVLSGFSLSSVFWSILREVVCMQHQ